MITLTRKISLAVAKIKDIISCKQPVIRRNSVISHIKIDKGALKKNRDTDFSEIDKGALRKNRNTSHFEIKKKMSDANRVIFDVSFLCWRIIIYNLQKIKRTRL